MGTLSLPEYTNLPEDCKNLRTALKGLGCNEKRVIEILGRRTQAQRMEIAQAYQTVYSQSLHKRLKSAFNGKLEVSSSATSAPQPFFPSFVLLSIPILQKLKSQV
jgi:hypothetical protein